MRFCTRCGAARHGAEQSCLSCGHPFPSAEVPAWAAPTDLLEAAPRSTGRWSTPFVAAVALVALIVAGVTVGVLVVRAGHNPPTRSASGPGTVGPPTGVSPPSDLTETPTDGTGVEPTFGATEEPTTPADPTDTEPAPTDPNGVVTLSDTAALDPAAPAVLSLVSRYFQAINTHDYQSYRDIHTADSQTSLDPDTFRLGFESTEDSDAVVTTIGVQPDGQPTAEVTFTSHQNSVDGPNGDTCDQWNITLFLEPDGDGYLIGSAPSTYHASHQAC